MRVAWPGAARSAPASKSKWRPWYDGVVLGPERAQHLDALLGAGEAPLRVESERGELLRQPARAHTEHRAPAGQHVERRDRARGDERVAEREHVDRGAELDRRRWPPRWWSGRPTGRTAACRAGTGTSRRGCTDRRCRPAPGTPRGRARTPRRSRPLRPRAATSGMCVGPDHDQIEAQLHAIPLSPESHNVSTMTASGLSADDTIALHQLVHQYAHIVDDGDFDRLSRDLHRRRRVRHQRLRQPTAARHRPRDRVVRRRPTPRRPPRHHPGRDHRSRRHGPHPEQGPLAARRRPLRERDLRRRRGAARPTAGASRGG